MSKKVELNNGMKAIVDDQDYDYLKQFVWYVQKTKIGVFYANRHTKGSRFTRQTIAMHREILNASKGAMVDHINHDGLDNRRCNLRVCTNQQNQWNSKLAKNNTSGYKGVSWDKARHMYRVSIRIDGEIIYIGHFVEKIDAAKAYNDMALKHYGEFAYINPIP